MKKNHRLLLTALLASLVGTAAHAADKADPALAHARELLKKVILIDGHNDLPWAIRNDKQAAGSVETYDLRGKVPGQTDIARLREGGLGGQFWSVYTPGESGKDYAKVQLEQIETARGIIDRYPGTFGLALTADQVEAEYRAGRIASLLGIEGGHAIEDSFDVLRAYHRLGVRYMTLTHNTNTSWADSVAVP